MQNRKKMIHHRISVAVSAAAMLYALVFHLEVSYTQTHQEILLWLPILAGLIAFFHFAFLRPLPKSGRRVSLYLGAGLALFLIAGDEVLSFGTIERLVDLNCFGSTLARFGGLWAGMYATLRMLYSFCLTSAPKSASSKAGIGFGKRWLLVFACYIPYFIAYCPAALSIDSIRELQSILGYEPLNNSHPLIHQFLMLPFLRAGESLSSLSLGVALYTLFQMAVQSAVFALALQEMDRRRAPRWLQIASFLWYSFYTTNALYSITMWKDVLFGCITLMMMLMLWEALYPRTRVTDSHWFWFLALPVVFFLFCTLRNNGILAENRAQASSDLYGRLL